MNLNHVTLTISEAFREGGIPTDFSDFLPFVICKLRSNGEVKYVLSEKKDCYYTVTLHGCSCDQFASGLYPCPHQIRAWAWVGDVGKLAKQKELQEKEEERSKREKEVKERLKEEEPEKNYLKIKQEEKRSMQERLEREKEIQERWKRERENFTQERQKELNKIHERLKRKRKGQVRLGFQCHPSLSTHHLARNAGEIEEQVCGVSELERLKKQERQKREDEERLEKRQIEKIERSKREIQEFLKEFARPTTSRQASPKEKARFFSTKKKSDKSVIDFRKKDDAICANFRDR